MHRPRTIVVGTGTFGRNHVRALRQLSTEAELVGVVDIDPDKARAVAAEFETTAFADLQSASSLADAAVISTPTVSHESVALTLLTAGIDVLVEKPIASSSAAGERMARVAEQHGRILQIGHLERFNPAFTALQQALTIPLFFEVHRLSVFTPRSLDVDVVFDLMIHDLDIVLHLAKEFPSEIRAAGISVLSQRTDIANVRLAFPSGCIANLTASRVSTEKVRKLRVFQPGAYISADYARQDAHSIAVDRSNTNVSFTPLAVTQGEPLQLELIAFLNSVRTRSTPVVTAIQTTNALALAEAITVKIEEHSHLVSATIARAAKTQPEAKQ